MLKIHIRSFLHLPFFLLVIIFSSTNPHLYKPSMAWYLKMCDLLDWTYIFDNFSSDITSARPVLSFDGQLCSYLIKIDIRKQALIHWYNQALFILYLP